MNVDIKNDKKTVAVTIVKHDPQKIKVNPKASASVHYKKYDGVYEVTPTDGASIELLTADRVLENNVVVHEIPYYETHNEFGTTVIIGE